MHKASSASRPARLRDVEHWGIETDAAALGLA